MQQMARNIRFRPKLRDTLLSNARVFAAMAAAAPEGKQAAAQAFAQSAMASVPPEPKKRAAPRQLEAPVIKAISELLALHPRVIWAARMNSGMASYEAKSGRYSPVWFHKIVRAPFAIRMPDFIGMLRGEDGKTGIPFACEAKAPGWRGPRDEREREQSMFLQMVDAWGGIGCFATSADEVAVLLK